jgi:uncharacterized protein YfiM (DUF2279 family)
MIGRHEANRAMRRTRILKGWRLWATVGLSSYALLLAAFCLAKIFSTPGSRWDISWPAVVWGAAGAALVVSLWTFLDSGRKN